MSPTPTISVLMPVYNAERYVAEAVESVLAQTFADFEFLVVDDGSTDGSPAILREYAARDPRIRLTSRPNTGIVGALNDGLAVARALLVARMDADDICRPDRLARQVAFLSDHPECVAVGCQAYAIDPDGDPIGPWPLPTEHEVIDADHLQGVSRVIHSGVTYRRDAVREVGVYRRPAQNAEDLDLYLRLAERGRLTNLPQTLLDVRRHLASIVHSQFVRHAALIRSLLIDAYARRGLPYPVPEIPAVLVQTEAEYRQSWAWSALASGHPATARKQARVALRRAPFSPASWKVAVCALRGY